MIEGPVINFQAGHRELHWECFPSKLPPVPHLGVEYSHDFAPCMFPCQSRMELILPKAQTATSHPPGRHAEIQVFSFDAVAVGHQVSFLPLAVSTSLADRRR